MTIDATRVTCARCGHGNQPGDAFCERCGTPCQPGRRLVRRRARPPVDRDATTRYLCAAAHLDAGFARSAIAEYLVEWTRAVPPSPGVDSVAVLREAVAARARRKIRDGVLLVLLVVFVFANPPLALLWVVVAVVVAAFGTQASSRATTMVGRATAGARSRAAMVAGLAVAAVAAVVGVSALGAGLLSLGLGQPSDAGLLVAALLGLLIVGVLIADEATVEELTRHRFRPGVFQTDPDRIPPGWERTVRGLGQAGFADQLARLAAADEHGAAATGQAEVIVHRGRIPFVGAGLPLRDMGIALPLKPSEDEDEPRDPVPFTPAELQAYVADAVAGLRNSASLSPGRRLAGLTVQDQVIIPADRLVRDLSRPPVPGVLVDLSRPPAPHMPLPHARALADAPQEAARYYRCFRVESWDRDLATSCFFTVGTDQQTLYLEWTHCVLFPVHEGYRSIDHPAETSPVLRALFAAVTLPASAPTRVVNLFHWFRPIRQRPGEVVPDRYGAGPSLREQAADDTTQNYFQDADALRYIQVIEQALFRAISRFLEDRGYSVVEVMEVAANITKNNINITGGTFNNTAIGIGRTGQTSSNPAAAQASGGKK